MSPDLALALSFADAADAISLSRFRASDLVVETKPDRTPVTEADRAVEEAIRERLVVERPGDGMLGEEFGVTGGGSRRWIVDPIDGTRNYSRGIPIWATLIALEVDGAIQLGVVSAPALGRRWWAERGAGAFVNGDPIHVSRVAAVEDAVLCFSLERPLPGIAHRCWHPRAYGDFWAHMLVAEGPSTARSTRSASRSGISLRCSRSSRKPAGASATRTASRASTASRRSRPTGFCTTHCWTRRAPSRASR